MGFAGDDPMPVLEHVAATSTVPVAVELDDLRAVPKVVVTVVGANVSRVQVNRRRTDG